MSPATLTGLASHLPARALLLDLLHKLFARRRSAANRDARDATIDPIDRAVREAAAVRALADRYLPVDCRFAHELYCAADRHERQASTAADALGH